MGLLSPDSLAKQSKSAWVKVFLKVARCPIFMALDQMTLYPSGAWEARKRSGCCLTPDIVPAIPA